eukprot:982709-Alexandrium_andersonii.AAC.1
MAVGRLAMTEVAAQESWSGISRPVMVPMVATKPASLTARVHHACATLATLLSGGGRNATQV